MYIYIYIYLYIYLHTVLSHKYGYMLLGTEFVFLSRTRRIVGGACR